MVQQKEYFAFISYQRKDEGWADRLRNKLEHYRLPVMARGQSLTSSIEDNNDKQKKRFI